MAGYGGYAQGDGFDSDGGSRASDMTAVTLHDINSGGVCPFCVSTCASASASTWWWCRMTSVHVVHASSSETLNAGRSSA